MNTQHIEEKRQQEAAKAQQAAAKAALRTQNKGALQTALERFHISPATPAATPGTTPGKDLRERVLASRANAARSTNQGGWLESVQRLSGYALTLASDLQSLMSFNDAIAYRESNGQPNNGYGAKNPSGALGRYQLTEIARKDIGLQDKNGQWNAKIYGVKNEAEFLASPQAQEKAFETYKSNNEAYSNAIGSLKHVGQEINGVKETFNITKSGLLAAAHRHGSFAVKNYLDNAQARNWQSSPQMSEMDKAIETRLREFADIPYN